jgi:primosomal protein N'
MSQLPLLHETCAPAAALAYCSAVISPLDGEYLYAFDPEQIPSLRPGTIVALPLGKRTVSGFVVSVNTPKDVATAEEMLERKIRVKKIPDNASTCEAFTTEQLTFFEWLAKYYAEPLSKILDLAIPTPAWGRKDPLYRRTQNPVDGSLGSAQRKVLDFIDARSDWIAWSALRLATGCASATIKGLLAKKLIEEGSLDILQASDLKPSTITSLWDSLTPASSNGGDAKPHNRTLLWIFSAAWSDRERQN